MNDGNDLASQLNSFSISSEEERLTQQLDKTHIASTTTNSIFALPSHLQQQQHAMTTTSAFFSTHPDHALNKNNTWNNNGNQWDGSNNNAADDWNNNAAWTDKTTTQPQEDDGWGEGPPSYTSISQGTYFGFNSIMEAPKLASMSNPNESPSLASSQAFGRFKSTPVTFTSAAAEHQRQQQQQQQHHHK